LVVRCSLAKRLSYRAIYVTRSLSDILKNTQGGDNTRKSWEGISGKLEKKCSHLSTIELITPKSVIICIIHSVHTVKLEVTTLYIQEPHQLYAHNQITIYQPKLGLNVLH
jgi:hypothetical protein